MNTNKETTTTLYEDIANSVGYAFYQCFDSNIEILKRKENEEKMHELGRLVDAYRFATTRIQEDVQLEWPIDEDLLRKIKSLC